MDCTEIESAACPEIESSTSAKDEGGKNLEIVEADLGFKNVSNAEKNIAQTSQDNNPIDKFNGAAHGVAGEILEGKLKTSFVASEEIEDNGESNYNILHDDPNYGFVDGNFTLMMSESESDENDDVGTVKAQSVKKAKQIIESDSDEDTHSVKKAKQLIDSDSDDNGINTTILSDKENSDNENLGITSPDILKTKQIDRDTESETSTSNVIRKKKRSKNGTNKSVVLQKNSDLASSSDEDESGDAIVREPSKRPPQRVRKSF